MRSRNTSKFILGLIVGLLAGRPLIATTARTIVGLAQAIQIVIGEKNLIEPFIIQLLLYCAPYLLCAAFFAHLMRKTGDRFMPGVLLGVPLPGLILLMSSL